MLRNADLILSTSCPFWLAREFMSEPKTTAERLIVQGRNTFQMVLQKRIDIVRWRKPLLQVSDSLCCHPHNQIPTRCWRHSTWARTKHVSCAKSTKPPQRDPVRIHQNPYPLYRCLHCPRIRRMHYVQLDHHPHLRRQLQTES